MIIDNKYNIGDTVFHITPESDALIVVDFRGYADGSIEYLITSSIDKYAWIRENELSLNKTF